MTQSEESAELIRKMLVMNKTLRELRGAITAGAEVAKLADEPALAFAAYHLADSIVVYSTELSKFLRKEIEANGKA